MARKVAACPGSCHRAKTQRFIRQYRILCDAGQFTGEERNKFCGLCEGSSSVGIERMPKKRRDSRSGMVPVKGGVEEDRCCIRLAQNSRDPLAFPIAAPSPFVIPSPLFRDTLASPHVTRTHLRRASGLVQPSVHTTRLGRVVFLTRSLRSTSTWSAKATECARQRTSDQSSSGKNL